MPKQLGLLSSVGVFGFVVAASAQTPPAYPAGTAFDGTYRFVSAAKVNQTYVARSGQLGQCQTRTPGPLTIVQGQARYTTETGYQLLGPVGPNGQLDMRLTADGSGAQRPMDLRTTATGIDGSGTVRARQIGGSCSYDYVWQKQR